jgi:hypothetical protein
MPNYSSTPPPARIAPRSLVLLRPTGPLVLAALLLGGVLLAANGLKLAAGYPPWRNGLGSLLGLGLLLRGGYLLARGNRPRLLTIDRETLHLEPLTAGPTQPAETIPLSRIVAYTYWMRLLKFRAFAQYHLRLELADGRVLHLADRPSARPNDPADTVRLNVLAQRLARRHKAGLVRRPLFYQTQAARGLLWLSWAALAVGLALGVSAAVLLLLLAVSYWASYYLGRGTAELTE